MKTTTKPLSLNSEILRNISGGQLAPPLGPFGITLRTVTCNACPEPTWTKKDTGCNCA